MDTNNRLNDEEAHDLAVRHLAELLGSSTLPSMISASTRFFAQPRLIIPTFGRGSGCGGRRVACME